ncbi:MAG: GntR family transcriptional regulator [Proteobacteria bacterium]|nr:GntR family transcriptional regulator [Pseudomonadota bacterium]
MARHATLASPSRSSGNFDVPKLARSTLNDEVYESLKEALIQGRIAPGSTMTIRSLAASFGISMMPVREALRRLVAEHVLVMLPNRSVALPVFTAERFHEVTQIRFALEGLAAEEGARHITPEKIAHMIHMTEKMERETDNDATARLGWNTEFHFTLYRASGMSTLVALIEGLWLQIGPLLNLPITELYERTPGYFFEHHHRAIEGLKAGRPADVRKAILGDISAAAQTIAERLSSVTAQQRT